MTEPPLTTPQNDPGGERWELASEQTLHAAFTAVERSRRQGVATPAVAMVLARSEAAALAPAVPAVAERRRPLRFVVDQLRAIMVCEAQRVPPGVLASVLLVTVAGLVLAISPLVEVDVPFVGALSAGDFVGVASTLTTLVAALACSARDMRDELMRAMLLRPRTVLAARMVVLLGVAIATSVAAGATAGGLGVPRGGVVSVMGWLGPALVGAAALMVAGMFVSTATAWTSAVVTAAVVVRVGPLLAGQADALVAVVSLGAGVPALGATAGLTTRAGLAEAR